MQPSSTAGAEAAQLLQPSAAPATSVAGSVNGGNAAGTAAPGSSVARPPPAPKRAAEGEVEVPIRRKKKQHGRMNVDQDVAEVSPADYVKVVPYRRTGVDAENAPGRPVLLSKTDKAPGLVLSDDRTAVTGHKGYRMVRATHGAHQGTFYCEVTATHLGVTGHARVGWATKKAEINAPVGFDAFGYSYRDLEGSKVHRAMREPYGAVFKEGDTVGLFLHMPSGGRPMERQVQDVVRYKGALYTVQEEEGQPGQLPGSCIAFTLNGALQGVAFSDILEGTYYPAASTFTLPEQAEGATLTFNFGPVFQHEPPAVEGCPAAQPVSSLAVKVEEDGAYGGASGASTPAPE